jgi:hypothetical protein
MSNFKKDDGSGMTPAPNSSPAGAVTSEEATRKNPSQGKLRSQVMNQRSLTRIDRNKHGIRRETNLGAKKTGRPKKV